MMLRRCAEEDLIARALLHELADRGRSIRAAVDVRHGVAMSGAPDQLQRLVRRPVGSVGMALGRHDQREVAAVARPPLDLLEQPRRRLGAVGDDEQSPGGGFGHGTMQARAGAGRVIRTA
jgi:hypothetical protein